MNSLRGSITNGQLTQHFVRRLQSLKLRCACTAADPSSSSNPDTEIEIPMTEKRPARVIQIPMRKERSATDILTALEKTISRDYTAAHYKFHDDPFLIPISNRSKRSYALSKESGRKAAMWVHKEHADLFPQKLAEPEIKAFMPKAAYTKKEDVSEELLLSTIKECTSVTDALTIYHLLEKNVSVESKQALLEFLCYYNNEDQLNEELIEERWYRKTTSAQMKSWNGGRDIEELFGFLKKQKMPIAAEAYNAMICGTASYLKVDRAWALFEECQEKKIPLCLRTYNHLLQSVFIMRDGAEERKTLLCEILTLIDKAGLRPNIGTFNAALRVSSMIPASTLSKQLTRSIFAEFKKIGVEPSLASYYFVLFTFCRDRGRKSAVLIEILDQIEGKSFTMQDPYDTNFFVTAMEMACNYLTDRHVADKIHKLLMTGNNFDLIGDNIKESVYNRNYMTILVKTLPFSEFMEFYNIIVPHIYIPEPSVMEKILDSLKTTDEENIRSIFPRLWSDMVMFEHQDRENLVSTALALMTSTSEKSDEPSKVNDNYAEAAWTYWNYVKDQSPHRLKRIFWTGEIIANIAILSERADKFDRFLEVVATMVNEQNSIIGTASPEQLNTMFEVCLERGYAPGALNVLAYAADAGFEESSSMAHRLEATIPLSDEEHAQLIRIIGTDSLTSPKDEDSEKSDSVWN